MDLARRHGAIVSQETLVRQIPHHQNYTSWRVKYYLCLDINITCARPTMCPEAWVLQNQKHSERVQRNDFVEDDWRSPRACILHRLVLSSKVQRVKFIMGAFLVRACPVSCSSICQTPPYTTIQTTCPKSSGLALMPSFGLLWASYVVLSFYPGSDGRSRLR